MFEKPTSSLTIGLEIDGAYLRAAEISISKGKPKIDQLQEIPLESHTSSSHVNPLYMIDKENSLLQKNFEQRLIVTALGTDEVLVRPLEMQLKKEKDIDAVLAFQSEPLLPYPIENALLDRIILSSSKEGTQLNVVAVRKDHVQAHIDFWNREQIEPEVISCTPFALALFSHYFTKNEEALFVVHVGFDQTTCLLAKSGKLYAAQTIHMGLQKLVNSEDEKVLDPQMLEQWRMEITRIFYALGKLRKDLQVSGTLLTGPGAAQEALSKALKESLNKEPVSLVEYDGADPLQILRFAVPIGACLSCLPLQLPQLNFRQMEFEYPHPWRRLIKPLLLYFGLCLGLALSLYLFQMAYLKSSEDQLKREYVSLLASMNKTHSSFEKEYAKKYPSQDLGEGTKAVETLSQAEIAHRLQYLQKEMKESPNIFPLMPNTPRVSDVLAWLSTHPIVTNSFKDDSGNLVPSMQIENLTYTMVKRPEVKKPNEKYQVKVELEFTSPTPKIAREFHDALIAPNEIVDPKAEVKWTSNKDKYRTSFFLKDKTVYP